MSAFSLQRILPVLLVSTLCCGAVLAEEGTDKLSAAEIEKLDALRLDYDLAREAIKQKQWVEPMEKLRAKYRDRMGGLQLELAKTGALEKALAAREAEKNEPTNSTINDNVPEVAAVQQIFLDSQRDMLLRVDQLFSELARGQIKKLSSIKGRLTQVNRLDSALVLEQEIKKITQDAKFFAASPKKPLPQVTANSNPASDVLPASPKKPLPQVTANSNPASDFEWNTIEGKVTITLFVGDGEKVIIPNRIEGKPVNCIGEKAFEDCTGLTSITIPDSVTIIGGRAFRKCSDLTSITIGDSVTSIGNDAFSHCTALTNITIPDGVTSIKQGTFWDCSSLMEITIPDGINRIEHFVFGGCTSLEIITIPDSVTSLGGQAFSRCTSLTSVVIGEGVTSIGENTFSGCTSLTQITFLCDAPKRSGRLSDRESILIIYRKPEAKGWGDTWGGRPVKLISEKP